MFWNKAWELFEMRGEVPSSGGLFHMFCLTLSVLLGIWLCRYLPDAATYAPRVVLMVSVLVIELEIYKLLHFGFVQGGGEGFSFPWQYFPFQFCSTPMYIGVLTAFFKKGRVHDSLYAYLATYAVFAGLCVMVYPGQVFIGTMGINVQTMICHGSMITVGIYLLGSGYVKVEHRTMAKAIPVFAVTASIAVVLNEIAHHAGLTEQYGFNMFYFSPYGEPHLVLYSDIQRALGVSNPLNLVIYLAGFTLAAYVILLSAMVICRRRSCRLEEELPA